MSDLPVLPEMNLIETDPKKIISDFKYLYEAISGRTITKADHVYNFIVTIAAAIVLQRQQFDAANKQNFLVYAENERLDHLGAMRDTPRLDKQGSSTTLEFRLASARNEDVVVPMGTRATADSVVFFATVEPLIIKKGTLFGRVTATSLQLGSQTNIFEIGEISIIVDRPPFVTSVTNINKTQGGRDVEEDEPYRQRIYKAPAKFSIAGPKDAYEALAKQASSAIGEVTVDSNTAGTVQIYPLLTNGEIPNQATLDLIDSELSASKVRPLCDSVQVLAPEQIQYDLSVTYYIDTIDTPRLDSLRVSIEAEIEAWILWQRLKIGRDVNPSNLISRLVRTGAKRVEVTTPISKKIEINQLAVIRNKTVLFGGLEDE